MSNPEKQCTICKAVKPLSDFSRWSRGKDGHHYMCRPCYRTYNQEYRLKNRERMRENARKRWAKNRDKYNKYQREYRANNRETRLPREKAIRDANREKINQQKRALYWNDPEKYRTQNRRFHAENRHKMKEWYRKYRQRNREVVRARGRAGEQRRRNAKRSLPDTLTDEEWQRILEVHFNRCHYCGCGGKLEEDHIIPVCKGGGHTKENIVPACKRCNAEKGVSDYEDYVARKQGELQPELF